jgi:hypothetical protein
MEGSVRATARKNGNIYIRLNAAQATEFRSLESFADDLSMALKCQKHPDISRSKGKPVKAPLPALSGVYQILTLTSQAASRE